MVKNINMNLLSTQLMVITMMTLVQPKATSLKALMNKFSKLQIVKSLMVKLGIMVN